jgi:hypothetical protein
LHSCWL